MIEKNKKLCKWCKKEKLKSEFYTRGKGILRPECKECDLKLRKEHYNKKNPIIKKCIICGTEFSTFKLRTGKLCNSKECKKSYQKIYNIIRNYGEVALLVLKKYNYKCAIKGCMNRKVSIHHIDWDNTNNIIENMIVLCKHHHQKVHTYIPISKELKVIWFGEWLKSVV